jgi:hypothetical protein
MLVERRKDNAKPSPPTLLSEIGGIASPNGEAT